MTTLGFNEQEFTKVAKLISETLRNEKSIKEIKEEVRELLN